MIEGKQFGCQCGKDETLTTSKKNTKEMNIFRTKSNLHLSCVMKGSFVDRKQLDHIF